ncbi:hypothetical protein B9Z65_4627 [Elsinoe australis]|uniref:Uncharacterized protein n=1 Tax=Elsinoe australis TaxID=40998 RepID=A0A2P8A5K8_9PEZI|nr:hypothetical protein B9Z65_4627 [Elsinoe australis]
MASVYQAFLRSPRLDQLASNASIHYITTTTSIQSPEAIIKHLEAHSRQVEKKEEKILNTTEASNGVCLETETVLEFKRGGSVILPGIDTNMLMDVTVVCPMVHVVTLDSNGKISQIRIYWDQATLLKQVEAIGKSGRNWPIRDGQAQVKLVQSSVKTPGQAAVSASQRDVADRTASGRMPDDYTKRLFVTGEEPERSRSTSGVIPRESAKPAARQWGELFAGEEQEEADAESNIGSPSVRDAYQPVLKAGAGKNFQPNRLFDKNALTERERSPERKKADPTKHSHFEFGNGEDAAPVAGRGGNPKKVNNWDFEDFSTPAKHVQKPQREQERHFGYGIDDDEKTPHKRNPSHPPRPDADTHFEMSEDIKPSKGPLATTTNVNAARRHADHDPHFHHGASPGGANNAENVPKSNTNAALKPRSDMVSNWALEDMQDPSQMEKNKKIYKTAGDGMGGKAGSRLWDIAGDEEPEQYGGQGGTKQVYKTAGNGMGGRKGTGLGWAIGYPDE